MSILKRITISFIASCLVFALMAGWFLYILHVEDAVAPASLPRFYITTDRNLWDRGYVSASGTWVMESPDEMANPIRTSKITCVYRDKVCRESTAEITNLFSRQLSLNTDIHQIIKWDSDQIVYENDESICNVYYYFLNRVTKQVTGIRKPKKDAPKDTCGKYEERDIKLNLVNGFDVYWKIKQEAMSPFKRVTPLALLLLVGLYSQWFIWRRLGKSKLDKERI